MPWEPSIAGGHGIGIYRQVARAVQLSKLKEFYEPQESKTITITQAFYHATKESGSVFGKVGSFEKGYAFNALVIDNMEDPMDQNDGRGETGAFLLHRR